MNGITLATEDVLSEAVGQRLVKELDGMLVVVQCLRRDGSGYLRSRIGNLCDLARQRAVLLITDLDRKPCAATLLQEWLARRTKPPSLLCRVAVREVESWLLADQEMIRLIWERPNLRLPERPDELDDPKQYLIELAKKAPRAVREAIVPEHGALASKGLGYNNLLVQAVALQWSPARAAQRSESLMRARSRLAELARSRASQSP